MFYLTLHLPTGVTFSVKRYWKLRKSSFSLMSPKCPSVWMEPHGIVELLDCILPLQLGDDHCTGSITCDIQNSTSHIEDTVDTGY